MADEEKQSLFKKIFKGTWTEKLKVILVAVIFIAILIIFASSFKTTSVKKDETTFDELSNSYRSLEYCSELENKLEKTLENVKDIGKVKAFVMVECSPTYTYLTEESENSSNGENGSVQKQTTIYEARNGSITSPVVVVEILPKITGVLIVATGAKDTKLKVMLTNVVATILSIDISKVEVMEGR